MARLVAIDALNIIRRNWEANPATDTAEKLRSTILSTIGTLRRTINQLQPTHQVAVFDHGGRTFRKDLYEGYKASRSPMSEVLRDGLPQIKAAYLDQLGLTSISVPGVEADDTMATLAYHWIAKGRGEAPVLVSTDKDVSQLLAIGARQWHPFDNKWIDEAWVLEKFKVPPGLVGDCLALIGDSSDDIPGIRGIGEKTAGPLLIKYGGLEALLQDAENIAGKLGERLVLGRELARLSRQLVELNLNVTVGTTWSALLVPAQAQPTRPAATSRISSPASLAPQHATSIQELKGF